MDNTKDLIKEHSSMLEKKDLIKNIAGKLFLFDILELKPWNKNEYIEEAKTIANSMLFSLKCFNNIREETVENIIFKLFDSNENDQAKNKMLKLSKAIYNDFFDRKTTDIALNSFMASYDNEILNCLQGEKI